MSVGVGKSALSAAWSGDSSASVISCLVRAFPPTCVNSESKSLKAEQGGNLQKNRVLGTCSSLSINLQYSALTTYKVKSSGIEKKSSE